MLREEIIQEWEQVKNHLTKLKKFKQVIVWETTGTNQPLPDEEMITILQKNRYQVLELQETLTRYQPYLEHCRGCREFGRQRQG